LEPQPAEWAREIHCGTVEGTPLAQLQHDLPEYWTRNEAQTDESFAWPGGESYAQFRSRILNGLQTTAAAHGGQRVVIVTHAGVISQVMGVIRKRPASVWSADRPDPLTMTEVIWNNDAPRTVLTYNALDWC
jgi:broad specificity phosphatase PhoE